MYFRDVKYNVIKQMKKKNISYKKGKLRIFIYQLPFYGNLGDQAIAYAMIKFLKDNYPNHEIIENRVHYPSFSNIKNLSPSDKICLIGGGNFGDLYPYEMWYRNNIIKKHPNSEVIIFPVSIYYKNKKNINTDLKYYMKNNVKLMVRENKSYNFAKDNFCCQTILVPDIVNYLKNDKELEKRNESICVLKRNDIENEISPDHLKNRLSKFKVDYTFEDNHIDSRILNSEQMYNVVDKQLKNISSHRLIITDRLHGMIFAYITNTPAIILPANIKIKESYDLWYKDVSYINFIDDISKLDEELLDIEFNAKENIILYDEQVIQKILNFIG